MNAGARQTVKKRKAATIAICLSLLLFTLLIASCRKRSAGPEAAMSQDQIDERAVHFVTFWLQEDISTALSGAANAESLITKEDALDLSEIDRKVEAETYDSAYQNNEIAADNAFKEKNLLVTGTIASIEKDFSDQGYISLVGNNMFLPVHAALAADMMASAAQLKRGQEVQLVCRGGGRVVGTALLRNCEELNRYLEMRSAGINDQINSFLEGRVSFPRRTAEMIVPMYLLGKTLPPASSCFRQDKDSCMAEIQRAFGDKPMQRENLKLESKRLLSGLKVTTDQASPQVSRKPVS